MVGGGMAGLAAAQVLSRYFEEVVLLERDTLPPPDQVKHFAVLPERCPVQCVLLQGRLRCMVQVYQVLPPISNARASRRE